GRNPPDLAEIQNSCAVVLEIVEHGSGAECDQNARDNRKRGVEADQHGRHINGIAPHPCDWPIIIGGSDSEHAGINSERFERASRVRRRAKNFLEKRLKRRKVFLAPIARSTIPKSSGSGKLSESLHERYRTCHFAGGSHRRYDVDGSSGRRFVT